MHREPMTCFPLVIRILLRGLYHQSNLALGTFSLAEHPIPRMVKSSPCVKHTLANSASTSGSRRKAAFMSMALPLCAGLGACKGLAVHFYHQK